MKPSLKSIKSASLVTIGTGLLGSVSVFLSLGDYKSAIIAGVFGAGTLLLKYHLGL